MSKIVQSNGRNFTANYTFYEYPKWVSLADGSQVIVHNEDEEAKAAEVDADSVDSLRDDMEERQKLFTQAQSLGLKPHHKMKIATLRELIASKL
ncbi:MAG TPA: hypothetical protein VIY48_06230 [Candidatus Paceibacterota bacterium]